jgi:hypothetical protein
MYILKMNFFNAMKLDFLKPLKHLDQPFHYR